VKSPFEAVMLFLTKKLSAEEAVAAKEDDIPKELVRA
jgi:hypothetical protein